MFQAHGIGYALYAQKLEQRMMVEQEREQDYLQGRRISEEMRANLFGELISICDIDNINEKSGQRSNRKDCSFVRP